MNYSCLIDTGHIGAADFLYYSLDDCQHLKGYNFVRDGVCGAKTTRRRRHRKAKEVWDMIYITGDCHGEFERLKNISGGFNPSEMFKPEDYVIVCGDMGLLWKKDGWDYKYNCKVLNQVIPTVLFVPGNHENYDWIKELPLTEWHGGKVRKVLGDKVIMLERGQVYEIEGKKFFAFGGASSHDFDIILDPSEPSYWDDREVAQWRHTPFRVLGQSWWPQELPNEEEMQEGRNNLEKAGWEVDYVISHCCSSNTQAYMQDNYRFTGYSGRRYKTDCLTDYFDEIEEKLSYKQWFFGHFHIELCIDELHTVLYESIIPLELYMKLKPGEVLLRGAHLYKGELE